jgi:hypothetical protein
VAPRLTRVALVANPNFRGYDYFLRFAQAAAPTLAIELIPKQISDDAADIERTIGVRADARRRLLIVPDGTIIAHRAVQLEKRS